ncbi:facilitated trehalose transporter Tret1-like isoform X2 [Pieris napi]|uniref:facilitated trehalose transporter Tret1-like isoform X2 n=1 Tax=Pieris napi TaxID=78633 RepID=UPI001FBB7B69|nr:facilitated trehalose transporter Tret1-like isoform X2 [Pieris napi]
MTPETAPAPQVLSNLPPGTSHWQWIFGIIVSSSFILYGLEAGWMSPMSIIFTSENSPVGYPLSNSAISWLASIVAFVAAFTVPIFAHLTDDYGRKWVLLCATLPQMASVLLRIFFPNIIILSIARALSGISASGVFVIVTVYLREISQHDIIAALGSLPVLMQNTGVFLIYLIGAYFDYFTVLWIMLVFPVSMIILLWQIPESPEFLVKEGLMDHLQAVAYIVTVIAFTVLGISLLLEDIYQSIDIPQWLHVLCMTATVAMYSGGIRPLPSIIITEMFSFKVRAKVMGVLTTYGWLVVSTQLFSYGFLVDVIGLPLTFLLYAVVNLIGMIFSLLLPETKGRTPEDIRNIFMHHSSPKN